MINSTRSMINNRKKSIVTKKTQCYTRTRFLTQKDAPALKFFMMNIITPSILTTTSSIFGIKTLHNRSHRSSSTIKTNITMRSKADHPFNKMKISTSGVALLMYLMFKTKSFKKHQKCNLRLSEYSTKISSR